MSAIDLICIDDELLPIKEEHSTRRTVYEWYLWSYFNVIFGFFIMGFIAIYLSMRITMYKEADDNSKAYFWSNVTLLWNIIATCIGLGLTLYCILCL
ncbi:hypothetical protein I4U23_014137 [Adineta vaga]|nr:hypothetical protein I4U23_014137 [Adineta vaga]